MKRSTAAPTASSSGVAGSTGASASPYVSRISRMSRSLSSIAIASLFGKNWYSVPGETPASRAMALVLAAVYPVEQNTEAAASRSWAMRRSPRA